MKTEKMKSPQKKIIFIGLIVFFTLIIFWVFVYLPTQNTVSRVKKELLDIEAQILEIETIMSRGRSMQDNIGLLRERVRVLERKFPAKEEEGLRSLSDLADKLNIEIVSLKPAPKEEVLDAKSQKTIIEDKVCQKLAVSIEMKSNFKNLIRYITALKKSSPVFVTIDQLKINKDTLEGAKLNIVLDLSLYLLS